MWEGTARKHKSWGDTLEIEHWSPQLPSPMTRVIVNTLTLLRSCPTDSADNYLTTVSAQSPGLIIKIRSRCRSSLSLTHPPLAETGRGQLYRHSCVKKRGHESTEEPLARSSSETPLSNAGSPWVRTQPPPAQQGTGALGSFLSHLSSHDR